MVSITTRSLKTPVHDMKAGGAASFALPVSPSGKRSLELKAAPYGRFFFFLSRLLKCPMQKGVQQPFSRTKQQAGIAPVGASPPEGQSKWGLQKPPDAPDDRLSRLTLLGRAPERPSIGLPGTIHTHSGLLRRGSPLPLAPASAPRHPRNRPLEGRALAWRGSPPGG